jgi:activator of 2-hydroxyglutaryl-CoA dehydratase
VARGDYRTYAGKAYLGIDAGSTTTKIVLLSENHELLYEFYASNKGQPLDCIQRALADEAERPHEVSTDVDEEEENHTSEEL